MIKEYIIKIDEDQSKKDIHGGYQLIEPPSELVRCGDCKWRGTYQCPIYVGGDGMCGSPDEWFCAGGERK